MFVAAKDLSYIAAPPDRIVAIIESSNANVVAIPGHDAQPTQAFIVGVRNPEGSFSVYIYLHLRESNAAAIYMCEPRAFALASYPEYEGEAIQFVESMGFMVDNLNFRRLTKDQQQVILQRIPAFHSNLQRFASRADPDVEVIVGGELLELEALEAQQELPVAAVQPLNDDDGFVRTQVDVPGVINAQEKKHLVSLLASF